VWGWTGLPSQTTRPASSMTSHKYFETYQNVSCGRERLRCTALLERAAAGQPEKGEGAVKRRILAAIAAAVLSLGVAAPMAYADPDFGPGNSSKGPNDGGAKCHPPGTTVNEPGCK
jgi:hypothetical protein